MIEEIILFIVAIFFFLTTLYHQNKANKLEIMVSDLENKIKRLQGK